MKVTRYKVEGLYTNGRGRYWFVSSGINTEGFQASFTSPEDCIENLKVRGMHVSKDKIKSYQTEEISL